MKCCDIPEPSRFKFPFAAVPFGTRLLIYGGGVVGHTYIEAIRSNSGYKLLGLIDKKPIHNIYPGIKVILPDKIEEVYGNEYDMLLIAIERQDIAVIIWRELRAIGIPEGKIKWFDPVRGAENGRIKTSL